MLAVLFAAPVRAAPMGTVPAGTAGAEGQPAPTSAAAAAVPTDVGTEPDVARVQMIPLQLSDRLGQAFTVAYSLDGGGNVRAFPAYALLGVGVAAADGSASTSLIDAATRRVRVPAGPAGRAEVQVSLTALLGPATVADAKARLAAAVGPATGPRQVFLVTPRRTTARLVLRATRPDRPDVELAAAPLDQGAVSPTVVLGFDVARDTLRAADGALADRLQVVLEMEYAGRVSATTGSVQVRLVESGLVTLRNRIITARGAEVPDRRLPAFLCAPAGDADARRQIRAEVGRELRVTVAGQDGARPFEQAELACILDRLMSEVDLSLKESLSAEGRRDDCVAALIVDDGVKVRDLIGHVRRFKSADVDAEAKSLERSLQTSWDEVNQGKAKAEVDTDFTFFWGSVDVSVSAEWLKRNQGNHAEAFKESVRKLKQAAVEFEGDQPNLVGVRLDQDGRWDQFRSFAAEWHREQYHSVLAVESVRLVAADVVPIGLEAADVRELRRRAEKAEAELGETKKAAGESAKKLASAEADRDERFRADLARLHSEGRVFYTGEGYWIVRDGKRRLIANPHTLAEVAPVGTLIEFNPYCQLLAKGDVLNLEPPAPAPARQARDFLDHDPSGFRR